MAIGRPMPPLILDDVERETLERWVRTGCGPLCRRPQQYHGGHRWECPMRRWGNVLSDEPRSGRPRAVTDDDVERDVWPSERAEPQHGRHLAGLRIDLGVIIEKVRDVAGSCRGLGISARRPGVGSHPSAIDTMERAWSRSVSLAGQSRGPDVRRDWCMTTSAVTTLHGDLDVDPKPFVWTKTADQILANVACV